MTDKTVDNSQTRRAELELLRTLPELLTHHLESRPDMLLYKQYDSRTKEWFHVSVKDMCERVERWRRAFAKLGLARGERVAMLLPNCIDAICFDQAALANALVPVPLHAVDTPGSSAYILNDSQARVLVTNRLLKWKGIRDAEHLPSLKHVVITDEAIEPTVENEIQVTNVDAWLTAGEDAELPAGPEPKDLACLVYTSGTTGRPKGVMLTHRAIMSNIQGVLYNVCPEPTDVWLSFLPLSHTFERTTTYYTALGMGCLVAFNRNIGLIAEDMRLIQPSIMMSVPRIYEKVYAKIQDRLSLRPRYARFLCDWAVNVGWRRFCRQNNVPCRAGFSSLFDPLVAGFLDKAVGKGIRNVFGGRARVFISGGAAFNAQVARFFLSLGIPIFQGYGMTETSPIVSVNKMGANHPNTVGHALNNVEVRIGENDELQVKGPSLMAGYWNRKEDTEAMFTDDGWLKTGDQADIYDHGHIRIKGRIKEIIVTSTGEKIPPADLEQAIETDHLIEQAMVVGEDRPYIAALVVVNQTQWELFAKSLHLDPADPASLMNKDVRNAVMRRIKAATAHFPNYGIPRNVRILAEPWTIDNGLLTPTLKLKRGPIRARYADEIEELYGDIRAQR